MTDITSQETDRIAQEIEKLNGSFGSFLSGMSKRDAESRLAGDLYKKRINSAGEALSALGGSARDAHNYFSRIVESTAVGLALGKLVRVGTELTQTYRGMVDIGQNFNGSLLGMMQAASAAGLPLDAFAEAVKDSGEAVSRLGMGNFTQLSRSMSESMMQFGMLGMTTSQMNKQYGQYLITNRRMGALTMANGQGINNSFRDLMVTTSALSQITGVNRDEIANMAQSALLGSMSMSRVALEGGNQQRATATLTQSLAILSSQVGEAGQFLSQLHANAFGMGAGGAAFTEQGRELISVGLGHLGAAFERNLSPAETISAQEDFRRGLTANVETLRTLAHGTGAEAATAQRLLTIQSQMIPMTAAELRARQRSATAQDGITKLFTTFGRAWELVIGKFQEGFLRGLQPLFAGVGDFTSSGGFRHIQEMATTLGDKLGHFIAWVLNPTTIQKIGDGLQGLGTFFMGLIDVGGRVISAFANIASVMPWDTIGRAAGLLVDVFGGLFRIIGTVMSVFSRVPYLMEGVLAALGGLLIFRRIRNMFGGSRMTINAAEVIVNGGMGGGGGGGFGGGGIGDMSGPGYGGMEHGTRAERRAAALRRVQQRRAAMGWRGRMGARFRGARRGVGGMLSGLGGMLGMAGGAERGLARGAARGVGRGLLHSALKKIPALGWISGLLFGGQRLMEGDLLGAGGEVLSGIAGSFPGLGTAASIGIDAALTGRDVLGSGGGAAGAGGARRGGGTSWGRMAMMAGAGAGVGAGGYALYNALSGGDEEAPITAESDPVLSKLDEVVQAINRNTDMLVHSQSGIAGINDDQRSLLESINRRTRNQ